MKWEYLSADQYCDSVRDGTHDTPKPCETGYKLVTSKHIKDGIIDPSDAYYISEDDYAAINERSLVEQWDVIMSMIGTVGEVALVKECPNYAIKNVALFKCGGSELKGKWLYYYLKNPATQGEMRGNQKGSSQQFLSLKQLRNLQIQCCNEKYMQRIVDILSAYDDLIENNRRQIKLLEEAAQRLYKEWFVNLRFPGWEETPITDGVPEGWRKVPLKELVEFEIGGGWGEEQPTDKCDEPAYVIRGTDLFGIIQGEILNVPFRYHSHNNLKQRKIKDGDIIFEVSGGGKNEGAARAVLIRTELLDAWKYPVMCASFCKLVRVKDIKYAQYLYDAFKYMRASGVTSEYDKRSASNIINYRWKDFLNTEKILLPTDSVLGKYIAISESEYDIILQKSVMIERLKEARDRLLPKLMSGELEVTA